MDLIPVCPECFSERIVERRRDKWDYSWGLGICFDNAEIYYICDECGHSFMEPDTIEDMNDYYTWGTENETN